MIETFLNQASNAMLVTDQDMLILQTNKPMSSLVGLSSEKMKDMDLAALLAGPEPAEFIADLRSQLDSTSSWTGKVQLRNHNGNDKNAVVTLSVLEVDDSTRHYLFAFQEKVSDSAIKQKTHHDTITGLPDSSLFQDRFDQALIINNREKKSVALLLIGLDRFTRINDAMGRSFGNQVLKKTSSRLLSCIRKSDTSARIGGDKFAVLTPIASIDDSVIVAEKVLKAISRPFEIDDQSLVVTSSIGISLFPNDGDTHATLTERANSAMRHAKQQGGDQYQFFDNEMNVKAKKRLELEAGLRKAINQEDFLVYYQPKVNLRDHSIVGMEALVRWLDPERGMISPTEFIPTAEETGMINEIGYWVLRTACAQNKSWQNQGLKPVRVSVNVSSCQFLEANIVERVRWILEETGLEARYLELELTESMLMGDIDKNVTKMQDLRDLGVGLSIDDFGTGYSSLSYLARFPLTTLKIDRAFIKDLGSNTNTVEIARAIIALSQGLKLEIVAEGAEEQSHIDFLGSQGCDVIQGFFYCPPVPAEKFGKLLAQKNILESRTDCT